MEQHNDTGTLNDLIKYRIETSKEDLLAAQLLYNSNEYRSANNRAYYAIFHAVSAIHALDETTYKKHKDAIGNFNKNYIRTEIFPKKYGRGISEAEEIRQASDYADYFIASKAQTKQLIELASELIKLIEDYVLSQIENTALE